MSDKIMVLSRLMIQKLQVVLSCVEMERWVQASQYVEELGPLCVDLQETVKSYYDREDTASQLEERTYLRVMAKIAAAG